MDRAGRALRALADDGDLTRVRLLVCSLVRWCVSGWFGASDAAPGAPGERDRHVARAAQEAVVLEAALSTAVCNRRDVIGLPSRPGGSPGTPAGPIGFRGLRAAPFAARFRDVEPAEPADATVALLQLLPDVPRAAANLPLMDAGVAAEGPPGLLDHSAAPAADRFARVVALGLPPLIGRDHTLTAGAHGEDIVTRMPDL